MSLIGLLVFVIVVGLLWYLVGLLPLAPPFKQIAYVVIILIVVLCIANAFGWIGFGPRLTVR